jgi:hypothetical protein
MKFIEGIKEKFKEFKPTSWSVDNRTAIYIIAIMISIFGMYKFNTLQKTVPGYCCSNHQRNYYLCW